MNRILGCLILAAACAHAPLAFAQETTEAPAAAPEAQAEIDPARLELARQVVRINGTTEAFDSILPTIADRVKSTLIRSNPQMQLGIIEIVDRVALDMVGRRAELDNGFARIWATAYTEDELRAILEFYQSPAGEKFAAVNDRVLAAQLGTSEAWSSRLGNDMMQRVQQEIQAANAAEARNLLGAAPAEDAPAEGAPQVGQ